MVAILLIHGNNSNPDTWRINSVGREINFEKSLASQYPVFACNIPNYGRKINELLDEILPSLQDKNHRWIVVCHSLGMILGLELIKRKSLPIVGLVGLDPTAFDEIYQEKVKAREWLIFQDYLPINTLPSKIMVQIHLNYQVQKIEQFQRQIAYYSKFVGANLKSTIILHPEKGHMLHWTDTSKIIHNILELCKQVK